MIYEFALEPELVASWHDRRVAYPILCQMGPGLTRVPCSFPAAVWSRLVVDAVQATFPDARTPEAQRARKNIEVLLRHLHDTGTRRNGRLTDGELWLEAARREHAAFPFGGIVVRASASRERFLVVAEQLAAEEFPAWTPPAPPVALRPEDLANALAPLLRCAAQVRFVDPFFDPSVEAFFAPMREYLLAAQNRRSVGDLRVQIHFAISRPDVEQQVRIRGLGLTAAVMDAVGLEMATSRLDTCERRIKPILRPGVALRAFAWGEGPTGVRMHNRYVLTEVGGIAVQHGLDRSGIAAETDDLTILSKEQFEQRASEHCAESALYRLIAERAFVGEAAAAR